MYEVVGQAQAIGVLVVAQYYPYCLVASLFGIHLIQLKKAPHTDTLLGIGPRRRFRDGQLDVIEILGRQGLVEALRLEILNFLVVQIAILVLVAEIEDSLEGGYTGGLEAALLVVEERGDGVGDGFLAQEEGLVDVCVFPRARAYAGVDLAEFAHDGEHLLVDDLGGGVLSQVGLVGAEHDGNVDAERAEVGHPEEGDALVAVVVGVDEEDDVGLADLLAEGGAVLRTGRGVDDGGGDILGRANARRDGDLGEDGLDLVAHEDVLDEGGDEARLAGALVAADTDAN